MWNKRYTDEAYSGQRGTRTRMRSMCSICVVIDGPWRLLSTMHGAYSACIWIPPTLIKCYSLLMRAEIRDFHSRRGMGDERSLASLRYIGRLLKKKKKKKKKEYDDENSAYEENVVSLFHWALFVLNYKLCQYHWQNLKIAPANTGNNISSMKRSRDFRIKYINILLSSWEVPSLFSCFSSTSMRI